MISQKREFLSKKNEKKKIEKKKIKKIRKKINFRTVLPAQHEFEFLSKKRLCDDSSFMDAELLKKKLA